MLALEAYLVVSGNLHITLREDVEENKQFLEAASAP